MGKKVKNHGTPTVKPASNKQPIIIETCGVKFSNVPRWMVALVIVSVGLGSAARIEVNPGSAGHAPRAGVVQEI
jgi:hypothetical protein